MVPELAMPRLSLRIEPLAVTTTDGSKSSTSTVCVLMVEMYCVIPDPLNYEGTVLRCIEWSMPKLFTPKVDSPWADRTLPSPYGKTAFYVRAFLQFRIAQMQ